MKDSGTEEHGSDDQRKDENGFSGLNDSEAQQYAAADPQGRRLGRYARPALIAGILIAVVCVALLVIIFCLDSFNATIYSVGGKDVKDATDEAASIRNTYAGARLGGIIALIIGAALAAAGGLALYRHRNEQGGHDDEAGGEDVDFEDLAGR
jgi:ABC-type Fe3+ transport system permease subunit